MERVRLVVPAAADQLRLARLTASMLASRQGFAYSALDELRLAIDELCFAVVGTGRIGLSVGFDFTLSSAGIAVNAEVVRDHDAALRHEALGTPSGPLSALSQLVPISPAVPPLLSDKAHSTLSRLVDRFNVSQDGSRFSLFKAWR